MTGRDNRRIIFANNHVLTELRQKDIPIMAGTGTLFTVSAPSGAGKTSLVNALIESDANLKVSISHTTRAMRPGETNGINYHFVSKETFSDMLEKEAFLEHATVFGNFYGTSKAWVESTLAAGADVILEIDWQGAAQVKQLLPDTVGIFIIPPSLTTLRERLEGRGQDNQETISTRIAEAREEISHYGAADFLVVNETFDVALSDLHTIVSSRRLTISKQKQRQQHILDNLLS
jgi:guanylate kinase